MQKYALTPLNAFQLVGNCVTHYWSAFRETWSIGLLFGLVLQSIVIFFVLILMLGFKFRIPVFALGFLIITFLTGLGLIKAHQALLGEHIHLRKTIVKMKSHYFSYVTICLLYFLLLYLSAWLSVNIAASGLFEGSHPSKLNMIVGTGIFSLLILILIAMITIYVFIFLIFATPLILLDGNSMLVSFKKSWRLVFRHWWHVFIFLLLAVIVIGLWQSFLEALSLIILEFLIYVHLPFAWGAIGHIVSRALVDTLLFPAWITVILIIFNDLKLRLGQIQAPHLQI
ncbi:MAG: hypothetical protein WBE18_04700 [Gammaproteobacteria bacterium]